MAFRDEENTTLLSSAPIDLLYTAGFDRSYLYVYSGCHPYGGCQVHRRPHYSLFAPNAYLNRSDISRHADMQGGRYEEVEEIEDIRLAHPGLLRT